MKNSFLSYLPANEPLLVRVLHQRLDIFSVDVAETVNPRIAGEDFFLFFDK